MTHLTEVRIRDLALLEAVDVSLSPGLNVVSGETGEGKSLLFLAISLLLGARARKGLVRSGRPAATVEGRFTLDAAGRERLRALCDLVEPDAEEVCFRRVVTIEGTSRAYLDGALCPVGLLAKLGRELVDVHGQSDARMLTRPGEQRAVLDTFAGLEAQVRIWASAFRRLSDLDAKIDAWERDRGARRERIAFLRFQLRELADAEIVPGEEAALASELQLLTSAEALATVLDERAEGLVDGDGAVGETCARAARELRALAPEHPEVRALAERLESLGLDAEDLGRECAGMAAGLGHDPRRQGRVEERLTLIRELGRRHACDGDGLVARRAAIEEEIRALGGDGEGLADHEAERSALEESLRGLAGTLLAARRKAAGHLRRAVEDSLLELRMAQAKVRVEVGPAAVDAAWDPREGDEGGPAPVTFLVAANPGEPEQPLERVASGGETARVLLALKGALAGAHRIPLLIFDEIDTGIGGRVGLPFGRRIAEIAQHHQVLLITHLPQVAAFAHRHLRVRKVVTKGRTHTEIAALDAAERVVELAAMLGGETAPRAAREQAEALITEAAS